MTQATVASRAEGKLATGAINGTVKTEAKPVHLLVVVPWLKRPLQRFVLPNWLAITIGKRIFSWRALDEVELAHELAHVRQWQRYGMRFIPRYVRASSRASRAGGDRYRDNAFEKEAERAAESLRKREGGE
jgi:hypothetical protein